jgi:hypothetical protein
MHYFRILSCLSCALRRVRLPRSPCPPWGYYYFVDSIGFDWIRVKFDSIALVDNSQTKRWNAISSMGSDMILVSISLISISLISRSNGGSIFQFLSTPRHLGEQNRTEQNRTEQNRTEQNRTEQSACVHGCFSFSLRER